MKTLDSNIIYRFFFINSEGIIIILRIKNAYLETIQLATEIFQDDVVLLKDRWGITQKLSLTSRDEAKKITSMLFYTNV
jgi:hypothetical protein